MDLLDDSNARPMARPSGQPQRVVLARDRAASTARATLDDGPAYRASTIGGEVAAAEVTPVDHRGTPETCRRAALEDARVALATRSAARAGTDDDGDADQARLVLRAYDVGGAGGGGLVVALAGRFDAAAADRLRGRCAELRRRAVAELIIECSGLSDGCHAALARTVARLRLQSLVDGLRVELHHAPVAVLAELGHHHRDAPSARATSGVHDPVVTSFGVTDGVTTGRVTAPRPVRPPVRPGGAA